MDKSDNIYTFMSLNCFFGPTKSTAIFTGRRGSQLADGVRDSGWVVWILYTIEIVK